jgi:hypothetical protein
VANTATPCATSPWSLLACALAAVRLGDEREARRLEVVAEALGLHGYGVVFHPIHTEIAVARGDIAEVARRLDEWTHESSRDVYGLAARLDALVAIGRRADIEREAPPLVKPGTYVEPFALRALGLAREQPELLDQAIKRFDALGLHWHAAETRKLHAA